MVRKCLGADEIEITDEMLLAGERVYREWVESTAWDYRVFIGQIYREMAAAAPPSPVAPGAFPIETYALGVTEERVVVPEGLRRIMRANSQAVAAILRAVKGGTVSPNEWRRQMGIPVL